VNREEKAFKRTRITAIPILFGPGDPPVLPIDKRQVMAMFGCTDPNGRDYLWNKAFQQWEPISVRKKICAER